MNDAEALVELMEADRWIDRVRSQREHLPELADLNAVETDLRGLAARLQAVEAERRPARDAFNEAADRAESLRQRRADLERRLATATAPARELAAMQQELDHLATSLNNAEDTEIGLLLELEPLDEVAHEIRTTAAPLATRRSELRDAIHELQVTLDEEIEHLRASRALKATAVSDGMRKRYESALARVGVSGAARVDGNRCDGCRIALSPLDLDRVRSMPEGNFADCPSCGRMLLTC